MRVAVLLGVAACSGSGTGEPTPVVDDGPFPLDLFSCPATPDEPSDLVNFRDARSRTDEVFAEIDALMAQSIDPTRHVECALGPNETSCSAGSYVSPAGVSVIWDEVTLLLAQTPFVTSTHRRTLVTLATDAWSLSTDVTVAELSVVDGASTEVDAFVEWTGTPTPSLPATVEGFTYRSSLASDDLQGTNHVLWALAGCVWEVADDPGGDYTLEVADVQVRVRGAGDETVGHVGESCFAAIDPDTWEPVGPCPVDRVPIGPPAWEGEEMDALGGDIQITDFDGDGEPDVLVSGLGTFISWEDSPYRAPRVWNLGPDPATGAVSDVGDQVWVYDGFADAPPQLGPMVPLGDLSGNGEAELGISVWYSDEPTVHLVEADRVAATVTGAVGLTDCGDVNGDGAEDLCSWDAVVYGPIAGQVDAATEAALRFTGSTTLAATAADLDGDGVVELVLADGLQLSIVPPSLTGTMPASDAAVAAWTSLQLGAGIWPAGDVDGDGNDDLLVGGTSGLWLLPPTGGGSLDAVPFTVTWNDGAARDTSHEDFDGDGVRDLAVGLVDPANRFTSGRTAVFAGPIAGPREDADVVLEGPDYRFGTALAAGDLGSDGVLDLLVGAPDDAGAVHVFPAAGL